MAEYLPSYRQQQLIEKKKKILRIMCNEPELPNSALIARFKCSREFICKLRKELGQQDKKAYDLLTESDMRKAKKIYKDNCKFTVGSRRYR